MCGIVGFAGFNSSELIHKMCDAIFHRGPDGKGTIELPQARMTLGMRRLAIIDIENGIQPFVNEDKTVYLVFNGEIYNYLELRKELREQGYMFRTRSDGEVILNAYLCWNQQAWKKLQGMFAIAIIDMRPTFPELSLVRDRVGMKPLYYLFQNGKFLFASELKALLTWPELKRDINKEALGNYLTLRYIPGPDSLFKGIHKLPAAHTLIFKNGKVKLSRWWQPPGLESRDKPLEGHLATQDFGAALRKSVYRHMISDVPVGVFLSGGIDSSVIAALMAEASSTPIHTFSIGFKNFQGNELNKAKLTAELLGANHTQIEFEASDFSLLPDIIWALDEPVGDAIIGPLYVLAREARHKVKVVLSGEGADEILGGYIFHRKLVQMELLRKHLPQWIWPLAAKAIRSVPLSILNHAFDYPGTLGIEGRYKVAHLLDKMSAASLEDMYYDSISLFDNENILEISKNVELTRNRNKIDKPNQYLKRSALQQLLHMQYTHWLPDLILGKLDKITMATSLEGRIPFMDEEVINAAAKISDKYKLSGKTNKKVLREFASSILPQSIVKTPKAAFYIPLESYIKHPVVSDLFRTMLDPVRLKKRGLFQTAWVDKTLKMPSEAGFLSLKRLFAIVALETWFERFCPDASWS